MNEKTNKITIALAGNPNSGKTTIFNMLTGAHQHVANYPGVTVEIKEGRCVCGDYEMTFIDLPGTYSLAAYSDEERIARSFLIEQRPDVVVHIVDSANTERNLYLTTQLLEMNVPLVLDFNMSDLARQKGLVFDIKKLSELLHAPIVLTVGRKNEGKGQLLEAIVKVAGSKKTDTSELVRYGDEIEEELAKIERLIESQNIELAGKYGLRWLAVKLLEEDPEISLKVTEAELADCVRDSVEHLESIL